MYRLHPRQVLLIVVLLILVILLFTKFSCGPGKMENRDLVQYVYDAKNNSYAYSRGMPLIFIGGMPRSGTTLMRAILDAHPEVRCGEETRLVPRMLVMRDQWTKLSGERERLTEAGITPDIIDSALAMFILEVIARHGEPANRLCNKDPFALKSALDLSHMFPNSQFLLMIRDGRAVVNSIISRKISISGFDLNNFKSCLEKWNKAMETMYAQCLGVGSQRCLPVYYEQLILHPEKITKQILEFLNISWNDAVLHHDDVINTPGGVSLSKRERSTDQVIKPINLEALTSWVSGVPQDLRSEMRVLAPMLVKFGYDPDAYPPNYGTPDQFVKDNTYNVKMNRRYYEEMGAQALGLNSTTYNSTNNGSVVASIGTTDIQKKKVYKWVSKLDNRERQNQSSAV